MSRSLLILFLALFSQVSFSQDFKFGKVSEEEVTEKQHPLEEEANAAILYKYRRTYYEYSQHIGFQLITEVHERVKIYNKDGFDWATKEVRSYIGGSDEEDVRGIKAYTYNLVDGKLVDEKLDKDDVIEEESSKFFKTTKFTMPAVKEGSVIEYKYEIVSPYVTSIDDFKLQYSIPINKLEVKVSIPEYLVYRKHYNLRSPIRFDIKEDSRRFKRGELEFRMNSYEIVKENIPAMVEEPYVDYIDNYAACIKWELQYTKFPQSTVENYSTDWEGVTKSIYNDIGLDKDINQTRYFEDDIDALIAGVSNPLEKAARIYSFVKKKVKWDEYYGFVPDKGPKKAYKEGLGNTADINLMLTAMLRYAKLNASPVLISTPDNGVPLFPTRDGFNYVISSLELEDGILLMDATDVTAAIGELPKRARNWQGRILRENGSSDWVPLYPQAHSSYSSRMNIKFEDGQLDGIFSKTLNGLHAKKYRNQHFSKTEEEMNEAVTERMGDIEVEEIQVKNMHDVGADIGENYRFHTNYGLEQIGENLYLKPFLFETIKENPFKSKTRTYPIFYDFMSAEQKQVNIMVPEGFELVSLPESATYHLPENAGTFKFTAVENGGYLRVESIVVWNKPVFTAAEYESLKLFYDKIVEKQNETIVFGKLAQDDTAELSEGDE
ncbi:DUF3857 and transglutaminase domain-containing protein [Gramella sp. GC03-9]|uniref:DUF3857 and transglutaminase domain-containing protein n=1 Tax=Christiangramia oceanisediminis TaxID=2920386 RepID=A0A9X2I362_9FLAO|nr:DUF3857 domain-containing protein [Gramella oceanisediminis]MCP9198497.1 DUF3857 and transglutaminase domain-containing protein [Gramella oceanisediminis]